MRLEGKVRVSAMQVHTAFPFPLQPRFSMTDFLFEYQAQNMGSEDANGSPTIETDTLAEEVYPRSLFVPHNQLFHINPYGYLTGSYNHNLPSFYWTIEEIDGLLLNGTPGTPGEGAVGADQFKQFSFLWDKTIQPFDPDNSFLQMVSDVFDSQGFSGVIATNTGIGFDYVTAGEDPVYYYPDQDVDRGFCSVRFLIMNPAKEEGQTWFAIVFPNVGVPSLYRSDDMDFPDPVKLTELKPPAGMVDNVIGANGGVIAGGATTGTADNTSRFFEVRLINGLLEVKIHGADTPLIWHYEAFDEDGVQLGQIRQVRIVATRCRTVSGSIHPTKWLEIGYLTSKEFNLGFNPRTDPTFRVHFGGYQPPDSSVDGTFQIVGTVLQYQLVITNAYQDTYNDTRYAAVTGSVKAVTFELPEVLASPIGASVYLYPEESVIRQSFNPSDLSVEISGSLMFNNFNELRKLYPGAPAAFWGEFANHAGNIAVRIEMAMDYFEDGATVPFDTTDWRVVGTGYLGLKSTTTVDTGGQSKHIMQIFDRSTAMKTPRWNLPWFDGWNELYFAAFLANMCGCAYSDFNWDKFGKYVPADPYGDSPGGYDAFFLPQGTGGSPLVRFTGPVEPWTALGKIGRQIGFVRYFDQDGKFVFEKFLPSAKAPYRIFYLVDNIGGGLVPNAASAIFGGQISRDLMQVRNHTTLIGVDAFGPIWNPIVAHRWAPESLYSPGGTIWDGSSANGVFFENAFVWMDSMFADQRFIDDAADSVHEVLRLPCIDGVFATWLQPDLYPGYWVAFHDRRTGAYDGVNTAFYLSFFVLTVEHKVKKGVVPQTVLASRYLPPQ